MWYMKYWNKIFIEFYRILKPGGIIISLTPDWTTIYETFYEDFTHRTPFTIESLKDIHKMSGFKDIHTEKFTQLPSVWNNKVMEILSNITKYIAPNFLRKKYKWIKFSKEIMLLSYAKKD